MPCPSCRVYDLVVINMKVGAAAVTLNSCSSCDLQWWDGPAGAGGVAPVLDLVSASRR